MPIIDWERKSITVVAAAAAALAALAIAQTLARD